MDNNINNNVYTQTAGTLSDSEHLLSKYYDLIGELCSNSRKQAERVKMRELQQKLSEYAQICLDVIGEIEQYTVKQRELLLPYLTQLQDKVKANHDCSACTGNCKLNHASHLIDLNVSNDSLSKIIGRLRIIALPLYSETLYPNEYRILRNHMALLENNIAELFSIESKYLKPAITEAQKSIHVNGD